jgi:N-acetylneuraminate synthase/pseudaminic acid synthase
MPTVQIGSKKVGDNEPVYCIAELSGNHGGSMKNALELIDAAKAAGADAVKLQVYRPDTITLKSSKPDFCIPPTNAWAKYKTLYELYEYAHTPWEWLPSLFARARQHNLDIFGSVFDETSVDVLEELQVPAYKIASPEICDIPLLRKVASTGRPVILSTGLASLEDMARAIRIIKDGGAEAIILKCSTAYPTPPEEVNLATIPHLKAAFSCPVGLSDHTLGIGAALGAVALGASMIEKHIKLPHEKESVDAFFSLTPEEFSLMVQEIRTVEKAIGTIDYSLTPEVEKNRNGRRSLYICAPVKAGETFTEKNIRSVRPGWGLETAFYELVLGRKAAIDLETGDRLTWEVIA